MAEGKKGKETEWGEQQQREKALEALIPSLSRLATQDGRDQQERAGDGSSRLAERLAKMRVEDRRRQRNLEERARAQADPSSSSSASSSSFPDTTSSTTTTCTFPPALHRGGLPVMGGSSSILALASDGIEEAVKKRREREAQTRRRNILRGRFSGPLPPESWLNEAAEKEPASLPEASTTKGLDKAAASDEREKRRRRMVARPALHMLNEQQQQRSVGSKLTLVDTTLIAIIKEMMREDITEDEETDLDYVPQHLRPRVMALAGRWAEAKPLTDGAVRRLHQLMPSSEEERKEQQQQQQQEDELHALDSWDDENDEFCAGDRPPQLLDLSFSRVSHATLSQLLGVHVQTLLLTGSPLLQGGNARCNQTIATIARTCPNLQQLSLADMYGQVSDARGWGLCLLRKLSRATPRLVSLDLSHCPWVDGTQLATLLSDAAVWPRLASLYLVGVSAFEEDENCPAPAESGQDFSVLQASPRFVGPWHAKHHAAHRHLCRHHHQHQNQDSQHHHHHHQSRQSGSRDGNSAQQTGWDVGASSEERVTNSSTPPCTRVYHGASSSYPTRCLATGKRVGAAQWERARVLDALGSPGPANTELSVAPGHRRAVLCQVYF